MSYFVHVKDAALDSYDVRRKHELADGESFFLSDSLVYVFSTSRAANEKKIALQNDGLLFTVTFIATDEQRTAWHERERERFRTGEYLRTPFHSLRVHYPEHFAHLSTTHAGLIAYTPNEEKGIADRQIRIRPAKYLQDFYGVDSESAAKHVDESERLTKAQIDSFAAQCTAITDATIKFCETPEQAEYVYTHGPRSCMSRTRDRYLGHVHPSQVFAGEHSDLRVAYLGDLTGTITARCVVWPEKKIAVRVYPDEQSQLQFMLINAGYSVYKRESCDGVLRGARVAAIEDRNGNGWIIGYIDGANNGYLTKDRQSFVIDDRNSPFVDHNHTEIIGLQLTRDSGGDILASGVSDPNADDDYDFTCGRCDGQYNDDDRSGYDSSLCSSCADEVFQTCDHCDSSVDTRDDNLQRIRVVGPVCSRYVNVCGSCHDDLRQSCDSCGDTWYYDGDANHGENNDLCESCEADRENEEAEETTENTDDQPCLPLSVPTAREQHEPITVLGGWAFALYREKNDHDSTEESAWVSCVFSNTHGDCPPAVSNDFMEVYAQYKTLSGMYPDYVYRIVRTPDFSVVVQTNGLASIAHPFAVQLRGDIDHDDPTGRKWTNCSGNAIMLGRDLSAVLASANALQSRHSRRTYRIAQVDNNNEAIATITILRPVESAELATV